MFLSPSPSSEKSRSMCSGEAKYNPVQPGDRAELQVTRRVRKAPVLPLGGSASRGQSHRRRAGPGCPGKSGRTVLGTNTGRAEEDEAGCWSRRSGNWPGRSNLSKMTSSDQRRGARRAGAPPAGKLPAMLMQQAAGLQLPQDTYPRACPTPELPGSRWAPVSLPAQERRDRFFQTHQSPYSLHRGNGCLRPHRAAPSHSLSWS